MPFFDKSTLVRIDTHIGTKKSLTEIKGIEWLSNLMGIIALRRSAVRAEQTDVKQTVRFDLTPLERLVHEALQREARARLGLILAKDGAGLASVVAVLNAQRTACSSLDGLEPLAASLASAGAEPTREQVDAAVAEYVKTLDASSQAFVCGLCLDTKPAASVTVLACHHVLCTDCCCVVGMTAISCPFCPYSLTRERRQHDTMHTVAKSPFASSRRDALVALLKGDFANVKPVAVLVRQPDLLFLIQQHLNAAGIAAVVLDDDVPIATARTAAAQLASGEARVVITTMRHAMHTIPVRCPEGIVVYDAPATRKHDVLLLSRVPRLTHPVHVAYLCARKSIDEGLERARALNTNSGDLSVAELAAMIDA